VAGGRHRKVQVLSHIGRVLVYFEKELLHAFYFFFLGSIEFIVRSPTISTDNALLIEIMAKD